jgi:subtilisin family serine protease
VIRVGGIGVDGQSAATYRPGAVDVVAPGINVTSLGITGTAALATSGTQYAVAYVAGEAALVRSAHPDLRAAQVAHRIEATADKMSDTVPDARYGWGMINPGASVSKDLPEEVHPAAPRRPAAQPGPSNASGSRPLLLTVIVLIGLAAAILLVVRIRRFLRAEPDAADERQPAEPGPSGAALTTAGATVTGDRGE